MPSSASGLFRAASATLIAHDASYRAASARTANLLSNDFTATAPRIAHAYAACSEYTPNHGRRSTITLLGTWMRSAVLSFRATRSASEGEIVRPGRGPSAGPTANKGRQDKTGLTGLMG